MVAVEVEVSWTWSTRGVEAIIAEVAVVAVIIVIIVSVAAYAAPAASRTTRRPVVAPIPHEWFLGGDGLRFARPAGKAAARSTSTTAARSPA